MMGSRVIFAGLLAVGLAACQQPPAGATPSPAVETSETAAGFAPETAGIHTITGVLYEVRGEFPMYAILVGAPEGDANAGSTVQIEAPHPEAGGSVDPDALDPLVTKAVTVRYSSTPAFAMVDILAGGTSLRLPVEGDTALPEGTRTIEGVLSGADGESGDLPNRLTVTAQDGTAVTFDSFIEPEMSRANGRTVTLKYVEVPVLQLLAIAPAA
jgi:hypothetical protein